MSWFKEDTLKKRIELLKNSTYLANKKVEQLYKMVVGINRAFDEIDEKIKKTNLYSQLILDFGDFKGYIKELAFEVREMEAVIYTIQKNAYEGKSLERKDEDMLKKIEMQLEILKKDISSEIKDRQVNKISNEMTKIITELKELDKEI